MNPTASGDLQCSQLGQKWGRLYDGNRPSESIQRIVGVRLEGVHAKRMKVEGGDDTRGKR